jgi:hypothetical protein
MKVRASKTPGARMVLATPWRGRGSERLTRKVDDLVKAVGIDGISRSEIPRICPTRMSSLS